MPKDLPGLYWDAERNRYFPLSSRPAAAAAPMSSSAQRLGGGPSSASSSGSAAAFYSSNTGSGSVPLGNDADTMHSEGVHGGLMPIPNGAGRQGFKRRRRDDLWSLNEKFVKTWNRAGSERIAKNILSNHIESTTRLTYTQVPTFGQITAFCTFPCKSDDEDLSDRWHILGESRGWILRCSASARNTPLLEDHHDPDDDDYDDGGGRVLPPDQNWLPWSAEFNLQSTGGVSSISLSGTRWVATGMGPDARIASSDIRALDRMFIVTLPTVRDMWASHLQGESLVIGASSRAAYIPDINHSISPEYLHTSSDVLSVVQDHNLIYTGSRNGTIHRFDKRIGGKNRGQVLLEGRFHPNRPDKSPRTSVLKLDLLANSNARTLDFGLFVSQLDGQLQLFDLRSTSTWTSARADPVVRYEGHVNTYTRELGLALDVQNDYLYAAGQDCRIRGWSLSTGEPLQPSGGTDPASSVRSGPESCHLAERFLNPFLAQFEDPICALQVTSVDTQFHDAKNEDDSAEGTARMVDAREFRKTRGSSNAFLARGMCLWAASGQDLWRWNLGERGVLTI